MFKLGLQLAEAITGTDLDGDGRVAYGARPQGGGLLSNPMTQLISGPMTWLRSERVSKQQLQGYKGGVNPILPYTVPVPYTQGRVRGLFIGINYKGTSGELNGCINDVAMMLDTLKAIKFPLQEAAILVDDPKFGGCGGPPTRSNIIKHMQWLVHDAKPGDVFFLHYSGHGSQTKDTNGDESDGYDETMVPLDYQSAGTIIDDDIYKILVAPLPVGARMTAVMDCCHSGTLMDLPFSFKATSYNMHQEGKMHASRSYNPNRPLADVVMFSGCSDSQTSADVGNVASFGNSTSNAKGNAGGACTNALSSVLTKTAGLSYNKLLIELRKILSAKRYTQVPQLTSTKPIDFSKPFSLFGGLQSSNYYTYQQYHQMQHSQPQQGYPPQQVYPPQQGYPPQQRCIPQQGYPAQQVYPEQYTF